MTLTVCFPYMISFRCGNCGCFDAANGVRLEPQQSPPSTMTIVLGLANLQRNIGTILRIGRLGGPFDESFRSAGPRSIFSLQLSREWIVDIHIHANLSE